MSACRPAQPADAAAIAGIYNHYIVNTPVTFEEAPVTAREIRRRLADVDAAGLPWLVAEAEGELAGYAYASPWKGRSAYRYSAEVTVYLRRDHEGRGFGTLLFGELLDALRARGLHSALGVIALPNPTSVALHEKFGMQQVARLEQVGYKFGRWIDVGYWELLFKNEPED